MKENVIPMFPHCDPKILHAPGKCTYCDDCKEWQELRKVWNIAFTGDSNPEGKIIDPAEAERPLEIINRWGGNAATAQDSTLTNWDEEVDASDRTSWHKRQYNKGIIDTTDGKPPCTFDGPAPCPTKDNGQHQSYWVLSESERAKGFVRPVRATYLHIKCGTTTHMGTALAETYARDPHFYGSTFCVECSAHFPVGTAGEFVWQGTNEKVGS